MNSKHKEELLRLRLVVGQLGERANFSWWPTGFHEASSGLFLEPAFSKTPRLARYHGVLEAARRLHDEHLSVGSYHLFRLPEEVEQDLHELLLSKDGERVAAQIPLSRESALDVLKGIAGNASKFSEGPNAVGSLEDLGSPNFLNACAGAYLLAFSQNARSYPYLVS